MSVILAVHDIGRAGDPSATVRTEHASADAAKTALVALYGPAVRGRGTTSGTIVAMCGRVAQASKTWIIR